ncbi:MAG TPA: peptidyl-prolyl cis-trans isomerase [Solirubrobacteraceae bacterium]
MKKYRRSITALCAFFVVGAGLAACGSDVPGNSVADVAGNPITTQAFNHWMYVAAKSQAAQSPGSPVIVPSDPPNFTKCIAQVRKQVPTLAKTAEKQLKADCKQLFTSLSSQVMDFLIKGYWYQALAAKLGIKVSDADVQKAFNAAKTQQFQTPAQFQNFLSQTGQTQADILFRFRINQLFQKLIARHTTKITPTVIQQYYQAHLSQFGTPQTRDIRIVLTKTEAQAKAAKAALASGQSWAAVTKKYSNDPTSKNNGGLLKGVTKGQEDKALDTAAFSAQVSKIGGPIQGQFGWYVYEVTKITKPTQQTLAQATPLIQQTLQGKQQTNSQTALDKQAKKAWLSQTKCRSDYAMADCSGYKAPKTSTTTAPSQTAPPQTAPPQTAPPATTTG